MESKYVIVKSGNTFGTECPIVFPAVMNHSDFRGVGKVVAAGFCRRNGDHFSAYGKSTTLEIGSRDIDCLLLDLLIKDEY